MTIKTSPTEFLVEEILTEEFQTGVRTSQPDGAGGHALFVMKKSGVTTPQVLGEIARRLKVPSGAIGHGGLKDRHAETTQHVTIALTGGIRGAGPRSLDQRGWRLERLGWTDRPMSTSAVAGNRFTIVIRDLGEREARNMDRAAQLLAVEPQRLRVVNYFGNQRFGGAENDRELIAPRLIRGEFERALKLAIAAPSRRDHRDTKAQRRLISEGWGAWAELLPKLERVPERRVIEHLVTNPDDFQGAFRLLPSFTQVMAIEAYQSLLWNAVAARMVVGACADLGEVVVADDPWGDLAFPAATAIPAELAEIRVPLLTPDVVLEAPWDRAVEAVLRDEGVALTHLVVPGVDNLRFPSGSRRLFVDADEFKLSAPQPDDANSRGIRVRRTATFILPSGAYATVVLRALGQ